MEIDAQAELTLSALLASRMPGYQDRVDVVRTVGLTGTQIAGPPEVVWKGLVRDAIVQEKLPLLLATVSHKRMGDPVLLRLAEGAAEGELRLPPSRGRLLVALAGGLGLMLAGVGLVWAALAPVLSGGDVKAPVEQSVPPAAAALADEPATTEGVEAAAQAARDEQDAEVAAGVGLALFAPGAAVVAAGAGVVADEVAQEGAAAAESSEMAAGPCPGVSGAVVGYAYAGGTLAEKQGDTWVTPGATYVRAAYPRAGNGWDARAKVVCSLPAGARVRLEAAPLNVAGGAVWVPVVAGTITLSVEGDGAPR